MLRKLGLAIYRGFFWTYERGTWQYDVMVILILVFVLGTPRSWFRDRPLSTGGSAVVLLLDENGLKLYQVPAGLIKIKTDGSVKQGVERVLRGFTGSSVDITRIEPATDSHGQVISYAVWVRQ